MWGPTRATAKHIFIVSFPSFRTDLSANNLLRNFSESPVTARVAGESSEGCRYRLQLSRRLMQRRDEQGIRKPLNITIRLLNSMACGAQYLTFQVIEAHSNFEGNLIVRRSSYQRFDRGDLKS